MILMKGCRSSVYVWWHLLSQMDCLISMLLCEMRILPCQACDQFSVVGDVLKCLTMGPMGQGCTYQLRSVEYERLR